MMQSMKSLHHFGRAGRRNLTAGWESLRLAPLIEHWFRRTWTVSQLLTVTALFILIPCFVIAYIALEAHLHTNRLELRAQVGAEAKQLAQIVGGEIDELRDLGGHLARIEPLLRADTERLKSVFVASLSNERRHDVHVVLADATGQQLLNTRGQPNAVLPRIADLAGLELVSRERRPAVRLVPRDSVTGQALYAVITPVLRDDRVERIVITNRSADHLIDIMNQHLPTGWKGALFDAEGRIFLTGTPQAPAPILPDDVPHGRPLTLGGGNGGTVNSYIKLDEVNWTIGVAVADHDLPGNRLPLLFSVQGAVIGLSLFIAWLVTQRIVSQITVVERFASQIGISSASTPPDVSISEKRRVAEALGRASHALQQSRRRLYSMISSASDAIICTDRQGHVTLFNAAAESMFGRADAIGQPIGKFLDEAFVQEHARQSTPLECTGWRASGEAFTGEVSVAQSPDDDEYHRSFIIRDITKQREIAAQNARLAVAVESSADGIVSLGTDLAVLSWNRSAERIFGYTAEEVVGRSYLAIIPDELKERFLHNCERICSGEVISLTAERRHKDGRLIPVEINSAPLRDERGIVIGISSVLRDVTERTAARLAVNRLAAIVESSVDAIVGLARDGTITSWNPAAWKLFGYAADEAVGRSLNLLLPPDDPDKLEDKLARLDSGGPACVQTERVRKDGSRVAVSVTASPIRDASGILTGYAVVYRDVTESRRHEQNMRIVMRELSHRAKNLLAVITAMARSMSSSTTDIAVFVESFSTRIHGLARSHDLLVKKDWTSASLKSLVEAQLQPFMFKGSNSLILHGDDVALSPAAAQMVGLALNELATNAAKHGALTTSGGTITISWNIENGGLPTAQLDMTWKEEGGPIVVEPSGSGFGREVLEYMIAESLEGSAELSLDESGVKWRLRAPLSALQTVQAH